MASGLTHLDADGRAQMVDVGSKPATARRAVAEARLTARSETLDAIFGGSLKKGDALAVARIAGIMAAKKTSDLIPLCHPIALSKVTIEIERADATSLRIVASAETTGPTGVEMEALTAASIAGLSLYDMAKAIDRDMIIGPVQLLEKSGGASGEYRRES
jgi:cyclic pyranopterin phosphate synthase